MADAAEVLQAVYLGLNLLGQLLQAAGRIQGALEKIQAEGRDITDAELAELHQQLDANSQAIAGWDTSDG
jgi:hypothetical protein